MERSTLAAPRRAIAAAAGLTGSATLAFLVMVVARPFDEATTRLVTNLAILAAPLAAAAGAVLAARNASGSCRRAWTLVALAMLSWTAGQVYWTYAQESLGDAVPFPSWADLGYLGLIPLALAGLSRFPAEATSGRLRLRILVDGLIVASSLFFVSWVVVLKTLIEHEGGIALAIGLAYPAGDVLLATWVLTIGARVSSGARTRWWLLGGGVLALAFSDTAFAYTTATGTYATGSLVDVGWLAGFLLVGLAGVVASTGAGEMPSIHARATSASMFLPYLPLCAVLVLVSGLHAGGNPLDSVAFWTFLVLALLVILRQLLSTLENDVLTRSLASANARLRGSEEARVRLLNTITHDLLNPLTPVRLQIALLERAPPGLAPAQARALGTLRRNIDLFHRLVLDVKDLARLETGELPLHPERVEVAQLVDLAIETFSPLAESRGLKLRTERADPLWVTADRERATQVLFNLVSNAIKFTPEGGEIVIGAGDDGRGARVWVRDNGRGLTHEEIGRLFKPFSQVHGPDESSERGTGLGLFLSRAIAEQHGGSLWVESEGLRRGSTFYLSLPRVA